MKFIVVCAEIFLLVSRVKSDNKTGITLAKDTFIEDYAEEDYADYFDDENDINSISRSSKKKIQSPNPIKFYLYRDHQNEDRRSEIRLNDLASLQTCGLRYNLPLILLIHGVLSESRTIYDVQLVKNEYLRRGTRANIVMVDYGPLTLCNEPYAKSMLCFLPVLKHRYITNTVAGRVTEFLQFLIVQKAVRGPEAIHLIGFSAGAHMAGLSGKMLYSWMGQKVRRISGLDPGHQFRHRHNLEPSDAGFVDVTLSTNGRLTFRRRFGHAQFYINGGGPHQPGCHNFKPITEPYCSHTLAVYFFAKSIRQPQITSCWCQMPCLDPPPDCLGPVNYGHYVPESTQGNFYVWL